MRIIFLVSLILLFSPAYAEKAPNFSLKTDKGKISLKAQKSVVYVDFWATWCTPCRKSFPWMNEMHSKYKNKGLKIIEINLDDKPERAVKFLEKLPAKFTIAYDPDGKTADAYKVRVMPSSYLIDKKGQIIGKHFGFKNKDKEKLESEFRQALGL